MTRTPIPNCPQEDKPLRERAWTDGQRLAERIVADEVAVPVAVRYFDGKNLDGSQHYAVYSLDRHQPNHGAEPLFLHPPAQAAQVDKPPRLGGCCCGEPCTLGVVHRTDGPCFHYVEPTAEPVAQGEAVAWQYRILDDEEGPSPYWHDMTREQFEMFRDSANPRYELRQLYTTPPAQPAELPEFLKDPANVHAMMLRGAIAIPSIRSMVDLRGEVPNGEDAQLARIAELQEQVAALEAQPAERDEMSPDFTDSARAAITWVLYHHQGGSSPIGQPLRFALGMGASERLPDWRIAEAKRWAQQTGATTDRFHQPAERMVEESELVEIARRVGLRGTMHAVSTRDAGSILRTFVEHVLAATQQADR